MEEAGRDLGLALRKLRKRLTWSRIRNRRDPEMQAMWFAFQYASVGAVKVTPQAFADTGSLPITIAATSPPQRHHRLFLSTQFCSRPCLTPWCIIAWCIIGPRLLRIAAS